MITANIYDTVQKITIDCVDPQSLNGARQQKDWLLWIDISDPTPEDFRFLGEKLSFHPLAVEDCQKPHQRSKIESYDKYYFMILYDLKLEAATNTLQLAEINVFIGNNYLVTVQRAAIPMLQMARRLWLESPKRPEGGVGWMLYLLADTIVDQYFPIVDDMSDQLEDIEEQIFRNAQPETFEHLFNIKKQLLHFRRVAVPLREVFNVLLRQELPIFHAGTGVYFQDVYDHLVRITDSIDIHRDLLASTIDAYLSMTSNRLNAVMKTLTVISTILMTATLIAGIYGMNFRFMPELDLKYGYPLAILSMVIAALGLYWYFKKIRWI